MPLRGTLPANAIAFLWKAPSQAGGQPASSNGAHLYAVRDGFRVELKTHVVASGELVRVVLTEPVAVGTELLFAPDLSVPVMLAHQT